MNPINPSSPPGVILTDNFQVAKIFEELKNKESTNATVSTFLASLGSVVSKDTLLLTNKSSEFISFEYEQMPNVPAAISVEIFETLEFFERKLLRSGLDSVSHLLDIQGYDDSSKGVKEINVTKTFYIAFGNSDNLDYWSPFLACELMGADIFSDFGESKKVKLTFSPSVGVHEISWKRIQSFIDPSIFGEMSIKILEKFGVNTEKDVYPTKELYANNKYVNARRAYRSKTLEDKIHLIALENLIDKYFQVIFNTYNVLIVNPKKLTKDFVLKSIVKNIGGDVSNRAPINMEVAYRKFVNSVKEKAPTSSPGFTQIPAVQMSTGSTETQAPYSPFVPQSGPTYNGITYSSEGVLDSALESAKVVYNNSESFVRNLVTDYDLAEEDEFLDVLEAFYGYFGMMPFYFRDKEKPAAISTITDKTSVRNFANSVENLGVNLRSFSRYDLGESLSKAIKATIDTLVAGFKSIIGVNDYTLIKESDLSILKVVDQSIRETNKESLFNPERPLIIFGSREAICNLFYGAEYKEDSYIFNNKKTVRSFIDVRLNKTFNLYNSQNINDTSLAALLNNEDAKIRKLNKVVEKKNIPVFKYNTKNPNVISVSVQDNKAYYNMLSQSYNVIGDYASQKTSFLTNPVEIIPILENKELMGKDDKDVEGRNKIRKKYEELRSLSVIAQFYNQAPDEKLNTLLASLSSETRTSSDLLSLLNTSREETELFLLDKNKTDKEKEQYIETNLKKDRIEKRLDILYSFFKEKYGLVSVIEDSYAGDPIKFYVDQLDFLDFTSFILDIETLPFFPISTTLYLQTPCFFFGIRPRFVGKSTETNPIDNLTGIYNIVGYYHTITTTKAFSRFKMVGFSPDLADLEGKNV